MKDPIVERLKGLKTGAEGSMPWGDTPRAWSSSLFRIVAFLILIVLPAAVFWPTISHRYGFRDDYSIIREAKEEPGQVFVFFTANGRPVAGALLEASATYLRTIDDLKWMRLCGAIVVGLVSASFFWIVTGMGWGSVLGFLLAAHMALLPSGQIIISWAAIWTTAMGALLGLAAFFVSERAFGDPILWRRLAGIICGGVLVSLGTMVYQPNSLFYIVAVGAGFLSSQTSPIGSRLRWITRHLLVVFGGLLLAFVVTIFLFDSGLIEPDARFTIETDVLDKLLWFVQVPLHNALALLVINDDFGGNFPVFSTAAAITTLLLFVGAWGEWRRRGVFASGLWVGSFAILCLASYSVSIVASERWAAYRTIWPLTGVVLLFATSAVKGLTGFGKPIGRFAAQWVLGIFLLLSILLGRERTYQLVAQPQAEELALMEDIAKKINPAAVRHIYIVTPTSEDALTPRRWADEFGTLTTDSQWAPKEMLKLILKDRFRNLVDEIEMCTYECDSQRPRSHHYDLVIDLQEIMRLKGRINTM